MAEQGTADTRSSAKATTKATLVAAGWTPGDIEHAATDLGPGEIGPAVAWLSSVAAGDELLGEIRMAAGRISEVRAEVSTALEALEIGRHRLAGAQAALAPVFGPVRAGSD